MDISKLSNDTDVFKLKSDFNVIKMTEDSYEGAIVLVPKPDIYFEPVTVLDFSSLYPSEMIASDLSHDRIVEDDCWLGEDGKKRLEELGYDVLDRTYDNFSWIDLNNKSKGKLKNGEITIRFVQYRDGSKGLIPRILQKLLGARKATKKRMKVEKDPFKATILEGLQLAYKLTANSLYGQIGARTSKIFKKAIAASTTAGGRNCIYTARDYCIENNPGCDVVYGDSVLGDTPILLKNKVTNNIEIIQIKNIGESWFDYEGFKIEDNTINSKLQSTDVCKQYYIYTSNGWSDIKRVIKHKTKKKIYRITTHTGIVDVTEDHSLLDPDLNPVKPINCKIGQSLFHKYPSFTKFNLCLNDILDYIKNITNKTKLEKLNFIYGFFYGDGSCNKYDSKYGKRYTWALNQKNIDTCILLVKICKEVFDIDFKINNTIDSSGVYKIVPVKKIKYMVDLFRPLFYSNCKNNYKIIPLSVLNDNYNIRLAYFCGYYFADGAKCNNSIVKNISFCNKGKIGSSMLFYLVNSLGFNVSINSRNDKINIFKIRCTSNKIRKSPNIIKKIELLHDSTENFVYDIETSNGNFNSGFPLIIKNTDSVFVKLNLDYSLQPEPKNTDPNGRSYPDTKLDKIKRSLEMGLWLQAKLKEDKVFKPPHDLEYEKVYYPLILITKKRYIGIKFEFDPEEGKKTSMGVVTKRRDNAPILKHTFIGVVDTLMKECDLIKAIDFVKNTCRQMIDDFFDLNMFVISKTLREYYKDPESIAHKVLANRMAERDPGNKPSSNTRIPYVYIKINELPGVDYLQGDRIEHINYVREQKLQVDYEVYIKNQLMKPISQIFELVVEYIPGFPYPGDISHYMNLENHWYNKYDGDLKKTIKKVSQMKQKMVQKLIFDKLITYANNKVNKVNTIFNYYKVIEKNKNNIKIELNSNIPNNITNNNITNNNPDENITKLKSKKKKKSLNNSKVLNKKNKNSNEYNDNQNNIINDNSLNNINDTNSNTNDSNSNKKINDDINSENNHKKKNKKKVETDLLKISNSKKDLDIYVKKERQTKINFKSVKNKDKNINEKKESNSKSKTKNKNKKKNKKEIQSTLDTFFK